MSSNQKSISETHPNFPSGEWEGFYTYRFGTHASKHFMYFTLEFQDGQVTGLGSDEVGGFNWKGTYSVESLTCKMDKNYRGRHSVFYNGNADENGIWGTWHISDFFKGGFHIWPKAPGEMQATQTEESEPLEGVKEKELEVIETV